MKKALIGVAALLVVALVGGVIWIYYSLDFIVKHAIESYGSDILGAEVTVESVALAPADGAGVVRGLNIGNPRGGFRTERSVSVGTIDVAVDPASVTKDVVHVRRIIVAGPVITYESRRGGSNVDVLQRNAKQRAQRSRAESSGETRLIVDELAIRGARVVYAPEIATRGATISFDIPDIRLVDIGKGRGGVTPAELASIVVQNLAARMAVAMGRGAAKRGAEQILENLRAR